MALSFPPGFLWGASTASYQIEGGNYRSALWNWELRRGWERSGDAADSWRRWREDLDCLRRLNLNAYRFSVEWSRVEPAPGRFDEEALGRYREMASTLRRSGIRPIVCLHHFSEPEWLFAEHPRGWLEPGAADAFLRYVRRTVEALGAEASDWITFNEPMVWLLFGYGLGHFPPGLRRILTLERTFREEGLLDNVARAHREACGLIRRKVPGARVSIAQNVADLEPARDDDADRAAAAAFDRFMHLELLERARADGALDFVGLNYYTRVYVRALRLPLVPFGALPCYAETEQILGARLFRWLGGRRGERPRTRMGWEIVPEGFERVLTRLARTFDLPILVTENGIAPAEGAGPEAGREAFLRSHLSALRRAIAAGAKVEGYLHWSLMDNYEWGSFGPKFGLFSVERGNGYRRAPADGAFYYARVAKENALPDP